MEKTLRNRVVGYGEEAPDQLLAHPERARAIRPGDRFGTWTVLAEAPRLGRALAWRCRCDCGTERTVRASSLTCGDSQGCMQCRRRKTSHARTDIRLSTGETFTEAALRAGLGVSCLSNRLRRGWSEADALNTPPGFRCRGDYLTHETAANAAGEWRPIPGYEGLYDVSDNGEVRRASTGKNVPALGVLAQADHPQGYRSVNLHRAGTGNPVLVHRAAAAAFIGPCPPGHEVNHKDGNKTHNWFGNLEYVTRRQNILHACATGLMRVAGADNPMARITEATVRAIRAAHAAGEGGYKALGARFELPWGTIRNVVKRKTWASV